MAEKKQNVFAPERLDGSSRRDKDEAEYAALTALLGALCPGFFLGGGAREEEGGRVWARRVESALRLEGAAPYDGSRRPVPPARLAPAARRRVAALASRALGANRSGEDADNERDDGKPTATGALGRAVAVTRALGRQARRRRRPGPPARPPATSLWTFPLPPEVAPALVATGKCS